jgi:adenylosuccinate lyase
MAISPVDGRYNKATQSLQQYFSEYALMHYRVKVEVLYFIELSKVKLFKLTAPQVKQLHNIYKQFTTADAQAIKTIEATTNHDVKAVEYFIKQKLAVLKMQKVSEWVHFGLTSQDVNNTAIPMLWHDAIKNEILPAITKVISTLNTQAKAWANIAMLAKTHGQPASPTKLGKEILVFVERLNKQVELLKQIPHAAKFGGATGNFNAHHIAYPKINWINFANTFVNKTLGLTRSKYTTQIEHYDMFAAQCDALKRINTILIDYARDMWTYISMEYFTQQLKAGEVGSSAMPHKVNPIDFENAEGNLGLANAILEHLSAKLPVSRLQRDLTDSTVLRNIGVPAAHILIACSSISKGISKVVVNKAAILADLERNWAVVAEAIQTILRREQYPQPYEALKALTRGNQHINQQVMQQFINSLAVSKKIKTELLAITPWNYTGVY